MKVKVGDLVEYCFLCEIMTGIIVGFDEDDDPRIRNNRTGVISANWRNKVKIINSA